MMGGFIGESKLQIIQVSFAFYLDLIFVEYFFQPVQLRRFHRLVDDDDRVAYIAPFYQIVVKQHLQFVQKAERAAGCDLFFEFTQGLQSGMLRTQHRRVEIDQRCHLILRCGHGYHFHAFLFVVMKDVLIDAVPDLGGILFFDTGFFDELNKWL